MFRILELEPRYHFANCDGLQCLLLLRGEVTEGRILIEIVMLTGMFGTKEAVKTRKQTLTMERNRKRHCKRNTVRELDTIIMKHALKYTRGRPAMVMCIFGAKEKQQWLIRLKLQQHYLLHCYATKNEMAVGSSFF